MIVFSFACSFLFAVWFAVLAQGPGGAAGPALCPSRDANLDLLGSGLFVLGQMHFEHAVFEVGSDIGGAGVIGEREAAPKAAVGAFDAVILLAVFRLLVFAVARNGQGAIFHGDFHVLLLHFGQLGLDQVLLGIFADVHQWGPFGHPQGGFLVAL